MIPKEAFIAISLIMGVSCAFGYVLRGLVDKPHRNDSEWFLDGLEADHDRWEDDPEPRRTCVNCKFCAVNPLHGSGEPCDDCICWDRWEAKQ